MLSLSFDQKPITEITKEALHMKKVYSFFKKINKKIENQKLCSLGVLVPSANRLVYSIGGLILFGSFEYIKNFLPEARVSCARFHGDSKVHILDAVNEVPKFIARNTRLISQIEEMKRKDILEYPKIAVREALINALVHADYSLKGLHVQIAIFNNRLEIQNPGMFPFGFTFEDLKDGISRIRNRVISRVFHELKFMEVWGSGYKRIMEACEKGGYPKPKWEELGTSIRVTFYPYSPSFLKEKSYLKDLLDREKIILNIFEEKDSLAFREIFKKLPIKISKRMLRYDLAQLKKKGFLKSKEKGRASIWQRTKKNRD